MIPSVLVFVFSRTFLGILSYCDPEYESSGVNTPGQLGCLLSIVYLLPVHGSNWKCKLATLPARLLHFSLKN